jgi:aryl-alcohol dehydrogenase-like predicted oxidoreductase
MISMEKRQFGNSDMNITLLGYGAWAIGGGDWAFGWGPQDDRDSIASIHEALDAGMNWIDTAAVYGLGRSEEVVAAALAEYGGERPLIFTKCGISWNEKRESFRMLKAPAILQGIDDSLRRLKVDAVDLFQIHWPDPDEDVEEAWTAMAQIHQQGKARYIGVSNFNVDQMKRAQAIAPITSLQPPYSLLVRDIEADILPFCQENNIGVIVYSPMRSGLLSGEMTRERVAAFPADDWRKKINPDFQEPKLSRNLELVEILKRMATDHYCATAGEVAIAWTLRHPAVTAAIVGLRKSGQAEGVVGAADVKLTDAEVGEIAKFLADHPA